jgi:hypothetical protein
MNFTTLGITHTLRNADHSRFVSFQNDVALGRMFVKYTTSGSIPANHSFLVSEQLTTRRVNLVQLHSGVGESLETPLARRVWNCLVSEGWLSWVAQS